MADNTQVPSILDSLWYALQQLPALVEQAGPEVSVVRSLQPTVNAILAIKNFDRPRVEQSSIDLGAIAEQLPDALSSLINNWDVLEPELRKALAIIVDNLPTVISQLPSLLVELPLYQAENPEGIAKVDIAAILPNLMDKLPELLQYFNGIMGNLLGNLAAGIDFISRTDIADMVGYVPPPAPVYENLVLNGGAGNDYLVGFGGDDTIIGGAGADQMFGANGNDTYYVDNSGDQVRDNANGGGTDTVISSVSLGLGQSNIQYIENLVLVGTAKNGSGNNSNNVITGNDVVNYLTGGEGHDTLNGGLGADTMKGDNGDDTYYVDNVGDVVQEFAQSGWDAFWGKKDNTGIDTVRSTIDYTLSANLENLKLLDGAKNGTGNGKSNIIIGNDVNNVLTGAGGNDTIDGGAGADTMKAGSGNDIFFVDDLGDVIIDDGGNDSVVSTIDYTLGWGIDNLHLQGFAEKGTGNVDNNVIQGNFGDNTLSGLEGNDTIYGAGGNDWIGGGWGNDVLFGATGADTIRSGLGNDLMSGGVGADTYLWGRGQGQDVIADGDALTGLALGEDLNYDGTIDANDRPMDTVKFEAGVNSDQLWFSRSGDDLRVSIIGTADTLTIKQWYERDAYQVERFEAADGKVLLNTDVQKLVDAMASFAPVASGQTSLPDYYQSALAPTLAASWKTA